MTEFVGRWELPEGVDRGDPPREWHPLALAAPDTQLLRLWSHTFKLIEELPSIVKQRDEGWIAIPCRGRLAQKLIDSMRFKQLMWLSADVPDGRWIGRLNTLRWPYDRDDTLLVEFHPEPEYLGTGFSRAGWSA